MNNKERLEKGLPIMRGTLEPYTGRPIRRDGETGAILEYIDSGKQLRAITELHAFNKSQGIPNLDSLVEELESLEEEGYNPINHLLDINKPDLIPEEFKVDKEVLEKFHRLKNLVEKSKKKDPEMEK